MNFKKIFSLICLSVCFLSAFAQEIDIESLYRSSGLPTGNALLAAAANGTSVTAEQLQTDAFWQGLGWNPSTSGDKGTPWLLPTGSKAIPRQRTSNKSYIPGSEVTISSSAAFKALQGAYKPYKITLTQDIDLGGDTLYSLNSIKVFDGNNHTIYNFKIKKHPNFSPVGIFSSIDTVRDLTVQINGVNANTSSSLGVLVGHLPSGGLIKNCHVKPYLSNSITVTGMDSVGGLVGVSEGTIDGCSVWGINVTATNNHAGGIVGYNKGVCKNSDVSRATLTAIQKIGGITGEHASTGELSGNTVDSTTIVATGGGSGHYLGGIVGYGLANSFTLSNCKVDSVSLTSGGNNIGGIIGTSKANISLCSASRIVISGQSYLGGLAGASDAVGTINSSTVTNSKIAGTYNPTLAGGLVGDNNSTISSCKVDGATVTGPSTIGGLVGRISAECTLTADTVINSKIKASDNYAGGLVGCEYKYETTIIKVAVNNCVTRLDSVWGKNCVGGFVGRLHGSVSGGSADSMYIEASDGTHSWAGGIAGSVELPTTTISGVSAKNNFVKATGPYAGGITGWTKGPVSSCKVDNATVSGPNYIGGLVGYIAAACTLTTDTVINSKIKALSNYAGGLVGAENKEDGIKVTVSDCVTRLDSVSGNYCVGGFVGRLLGSVSGGYADSMYISASDVDNSWAGGIAGSGEEATTAITGVSAKHISVTALGPYAGGITGWTKGPVTSCKVDSSSIIGKNIVGGLVGFGNTSTAKVTKCTVDSVTVKATTENAGGLLGVNEGTIDSCSTFRAVVSVGTGSSQQIAGGLVGSNTGTVKNSKTEFATVGGYTLIGGLIGNNGGTLTSNRVFNAKVTSVGDKAGGLAGGSLTATISSSKVDSTTVNGINYIGGLVGYISGACNLTSDTVINSKIKTTSGSYAGGLVGADVSTTNKVTVTNCVTRLDSVSGISCVGGFVGKLYGKVSGGSADSMYIDASGNTNSWVGGIVGSGEDATTDISSVSAKHISVTALGLYAGGITGWTKGAVTSCRVDSSSVSGTEYVGGVVGHASETSSNTKYCFVDSVNVYGSTQFVGGIAGRNVGTMDGDTVRNSIITASISGTNEGRYLGGIVGSNASGTVQNSIVLGSKITLFGYSVADNGCGGIVGYNSGTVTKSLFSGGKVTATGSDYLHCGGIVGFSYGGTISQSLVKGDSINGTNQVGGIVGSSANNATIKDCHVHQSDIYSSATSGNTYHGGIVGFFSGTVTNCLVTNAVIRNYNTNPTEVRLGGIVGSVLSPSTVTKNIAMVDYFDIRAKFPKNGNFGRIYGAIATTVSRSGNLGWVETYIKYYHKKFGLYWEDDLCRSTGYCQNDGKNGNNLYVGDFFTSGTGIYKSSNTSAPWTTISFDASTWKYDDVGTDPSAPKFARLQIFKDSSYTPLVANRGNEYTAKLVADSMHTNGKMFTAHNVKIFSPYIFSKEVDASSQCLWTNATKVDLYTDILLATDNGSGNSTFWAVDMNGTNYSENINGHLIYLEDNTAFEFDGHGYSIDGYYNTYTNAYYSHNSLIRPLSNCTYTVKRLEVANFTRTLVAQDIDDKYFGTILDKVEVTSSAKFEDIYINKPTITVTSFLCQGSLGGIVGEVLGTINTADRLAVRMTANPPLRASLGYLGGFFGKTANSVTFNNVAAYTDNDFVLSLASSGCGYYIGNGAGTLNNSWYGKIDLTKVGDGIPADNTGKGTGSFFDAVGASGAKLNQFPATWHIPTTTSPEYLDSIYLVREAYNWSN